MRTGVVGTEAVRRFAYSRRVEVVSGKGKALFALRIGSSVPRVMPNADRSEHTVEEFGDWHYVVTRKVGNEGACVETERARDRKSEVGAEREQMGALLYESGSQATLDSPDTSPHFIRSGGQIITAPELCAMACESPNEIARAGRYHFDAPTPTCKDNRQANVGVGKPLRQSVRRQWVATGTRSHKP